jgi:hypothetical protein
VWLGHVAAAGNSPASSAYCVSEQQAQLKVKPVSMYQQGENHLLMSGHLFFQERHAKPIVAQQQLKSDCSQLRTFMMCIPTVKTKGKKILMIGTGSPAWPVLVDGALTLAQHQSIWVDAVFKDVAKRCAGWSSWLRNGDGMLCPETS